MNIDFITLTKDNIEKEHICCAFSDKKCQESYNLKKEWLKKQFENGYVFRRLNERAKVFIDTATTSPPSRLTRTSWRLYAQTAHGLAVLLDQ